MALINCSECGKEISDKAAACPSCGAPNVPPAEQVLEPSVEATPGSLTSSKFSIGTKGCVAALLAALLVIGALAYLTTAHQEPGAAITEDRQAAQASTDNSDTLKKLQAANAKVMETPAPVASDCSQNYKVCADNAALVNKYEGIAKAQVECKMAVNAHVKYGAPDWHWLAFGKYRDGNDYVKTGIVAIGDDDVKIQNMYGAMARTEVRCDYDLDSGKVLQIAIDDTPITISARQIRSQDATLTPAAITSTEASAGQSQNSESTSAPNQNKASFDCNKAHSTSEILICGDAELAAADARLSSIYIRAKAAAIDKKAFNEQARLAWGWREANCKDKACLVTWYAGRERELTAGLAATGDSPACLRYGPNKTALTGKLASITFPGPPNYESVAKGDAAESGFYLELPRPVCVNGDANDPTAYPQKDVDLVQLVLVTDRDYSALRPYIGTTITLTGTMFASHTGHHHAPLLIQDVTKQ